MQKLEDWLKDIELFQFLIGRLKTYLAEVKKIVLQSVSIPYR